MTTEQTIALASFLKTFANVTINPRNAIFFALRLAKWAEQDGDFEAASKLRNAAAIAAAN